MTFDPRSPLLVGISQLEQRVDDPLAGDEPLEMMIAAVRLAARDAGSSDLLARADAVCVTRGRWRYANPARVVADRIGASRAQTASVPFGGNMVVTLRMSLSASYLSRRVSGAQTLRMTPRPASSRA